jgi:hypothetical protein
LTTWPIFVFERHRDIEREAGLILAGNLIVDIPARRETPTRDEQQMVAKIMVRLIANVRSGQMPDNALIVGWPGEHRPEDAVDIWDDAVMTPWQENENVFSSESIRGMMVTCGSTASCC